MRTINCEWLDGQNNIECRVYSDIGGREEQQDCACVIAREQELFAAVCDGMGGLSGGRLASRTAIAWLQEQYLKKDREEAFPAFLERMLEETDSRVFFLEDDYSRKLHAGTTLVAAGIRDGFLYWLSVGDSRLYIKRGRELVQVTRDHNYLLELNSWLVAGKITRAQYEQERRKGEALISYIGMGGIEVFDLGKTPLLLQKDDLLLLTTDGLWKALEEKTIFQVLDEEQDLEWKVQRLAQEIQQPQTSRDNMTFILLRVNRITEKGVEYEKNDM